LLEQICAEVQIHVTTFFSYFASEEELAFAQTLESLEQFRSLLRDRSFSLTLDELEDLEYRFPESLVSAYRGLQGRCRDTCRAVPPL
jgi:AcrR family transcriptional regulator